MLGAFLAIVGSGVAFASTGETMVVSGWVASFPSVACWLLVEGFSGFSESIILQSERAYLSRLLP